MGNHNTNHHACIALPAEEIKGSKPSLKNFRKYPLVLEFSFNEKFFNIFGTNPDEWPVCGEKRQSDGMYCPFCKIKKVAWWCWSPSAYDTHRKSYHPRQRLPQ